MAHSTPHAASLAGAAQPLVTPQPDAHSAGLFVSTERTERLTERLSHWKRTHRTAPNTERLTVKTPPHPPNADEVLRFKHHSGLPELFRNGAYSMAWE